MSMLTRLEPYRELRRLQHEMDQLFGRWGLELPRWPGLAVTYPPVNVWEDDDFVYAEAELPGLKLADLEITVSGESELTVKGKREQPALPEKAEWHRQERGFGSFERSLGCRSPSMRQRWTRGWKTAC
jgi:HSP20 family protein